MGYDKKLSHNQRVQAFKEALAVKPVAIAMKSQCRTISNYRKGVMTDDKDCACKRRLCRSRGINGWIRRHGFGAVLQDQKLVGHSVGRERLFPRRANTRRRGVRLVRNPRGRSRRDRTQHNVDGCGCETEVSPTTMVGDLAIRPAFRGRIVGDTTLRKKYAPKEIKK